MIQKWQFIRQIPGKVASFGFYQYIWGVSESFTIKIYVYICIHMGCWRKLSSWYPSGVRIRKLWGKRRGDSAHGSFPNQPLRTTQLCVLRLQMLMCAAKNHWWLRSWWKSVLEVAWEIVWNEVCVCRAEYLPQFLRNKNQRQVWNCQVSCLLWDSFFAECIDKARWAPWQHRTQPVVHLSLLRGPGDDA